MSIADINHHLFSAVVIALSSLVGPLKSARQHFGIGSLVSQQPLQLFDLPGGLVVDDKGRAPADRVVKFHDSVGNRSRDAFIFPRTTHQIMVFTPAIASAAVRMSALGVTSEQQSAHQ